MERKIGEIFEYKGEWYQCVEQSGCGACSFRKNDTICRSLGCSELVVRDSTPVAFKKLEKVEEPFVIENVLYQHYKVFDIDNVCGDGFFWCVHNYKAKTLTIEIKQTKEDMEENKTTFPKENNTLTRTVYAYVNGKISDKELIRSIKEMSDEYLYNKNNLKPFDLEAAKEGKPVCTRDGRKARIICFDAKGDKPIIALVEMGTAETPNNYPIDGKAISTKETPCDLMMLSEKKEGWVNVYDADTTFYFVEGRVYDTKEEAIKHINPDHEIYTTTVKIEWEE